MSAQSKLNSFIDGDYQRSHQLSAQLNYRVTDAFKVFAAFEYKQDYGHAYWGTPLVPTASPARSPSAASYRVSAVNTFDGSLIGPLTIDFRTLTTNYNVADNAIGAHELWLRGGFEWAVTSNVTVKDQAYDYRAKRHWYDSETYAFNTAPTSMIDRDRFFVTHNQHVIGNNTDLTWNSGFFGMENRFAAQLQVSRNEISFGAGRQRPISRPTCGLVINPVPGFYGPMASGHTRNSHLDTLAGSCRGSAEDQRRVSP